MQSEQLRGLIAFIGIVVQLVGSVLLAVLFSLLRQSIVRRSYFTLWSYAWLLMIVAIGMLLVRYNIVPNFDRRLVTDESLVVRGLYFGYQCAKLAYYALLVCGTLMYAKGMRPERLLPPALAVTALYSLLSVSVSAQLDHIVVWQSPLAVGALTVCTVTLFGLPRSRRSAGTRWTGASFAFMAALWWVYLFAFGYLAVRGNDALGSPVGRLLPYNSYIDLLLQVLLAFGMVVMLMEDAKREVNDAHAELEVAHSQLRRSALYDPLTGALNRRAFAEGVGLETAKATFGVVAMLDMDNLKTVNDSYGHAAGDRLLQRLADVLHRSLRPSDRLYRWGGDEFLLVLPGAKTHEVQSRIDATIAAHAPEEESAERLLVSIGAAAYAGAEQMQVAIARADAEMYRQKHGRKLDSGQQAAIVA